MTYTDAEPPEADVLTPQIKEKWVEALRSGQYSQSKATFRAPNVHNDDASYCCLGVLCEVLGTGEWGGFDEPDVFYPSDASYYWIDGKRYGGYTAPLLSYRTGVVLAGMNDDSGKNFNEIADWVEENL